LLCAIAEAAKATNSATITATAARTRLVRLMTAIPPYDVGEKQ
jgi:hypothetical protein